MLDQALVWINMLNNNKVFGSIAFIFMNMGSKYVMGDLNMLHEKFLSSALVKKFVLFCIFFVGSRDIITAACFTFAFFFIINCLTSNKSPFSIIPKTLTIGLVTDNEYMMAKKVVEKYESMKNMEKIKNEAQHTANTKQTLEHLSKFKNLLYQ